MHCVTMLVTGQIADDLAWTPDERDALVARRRALYAGVVEQGHLHAQPFSEGQAAGALAGYSTTAEPVDGGYLVSGRKIFASLSDAADVHNVVAVAPGDPRIRLLGVEKGAEGLRIEGEWDPLGMRATSSRTLVMDRVFVPVETRVAAAGRVRPGRDALAPPVSHPLVHLRRPCARCAGGDPPLPAGGQPGGATR